MGASPCTDPFDPRLRVGTARLRDIINWQLPLWDGNSWAGQVDCGHIQTARPWWGGDRLGAAGVYGRRRRTSERVRTWFVKFQLHNSEPWAGAIEFCTPVAGAASGTSRRLWWIRLRTIFGLNCFWDRLGSPGRLESVGAVPLRASVALPCAGAIRSAFDEAVELWIGVLLGPWILWRSFLGAESWWQSVFRNESP